MKKEWLTSEEVSSGEEELKTLCQTVKMYISERNWDACSKIIPKYMELFPDSAVPHNLMGILLELRDRHADAMRHFRAALALDAAYEPAKENMERFSMFGWGRNTVPVYDSEDCRKEEVWENGCTRRREILHKWILTRI